jgi:hypothetical protein
MEIYKKLFKLKSEVGKISKDSTNPFFKNKYFDINTLLEHVEPLAAKHGLLILQPILGGKVTSQIIDADNGEIIVSEMELGNITDPQKRGSEITYFRRYTLQSLLGLQAEDDDGNKATQGIAQTEDTRPWLDDKGYAYLIEKGSLEEINTAFKSRRMKKEYKTELTNKIK